MIKKALLLALLLVGGLTGYAQADFKPELAVGVNLGTTFSSVGFQPKVNTKMRMGYTGGVTVRWNTEKNVGLQGELNFVQQGWAEAFEEQPQYRYSRTLNYVELPIMTHIYFGSKRVKGFVNLGPKVGYLISESTDSNLNGAKPNITNDQHDMAVEKKFDWGICGGPGVEFRTGVGYFLLEGRYYYALGDVFGNRKTDVFSKSAGQIMSVKLTYLFSLTRK